MAVEDNKGKKPASVAKTDTVFRDPRLLADLVKIIADGIEKVDPTGGIVGDREDFRRGVPDKKR